MKKKTIFTILCVTIVVGLVIICLLLSKNRIKNVKVVDKEENIYIITGDYKGEYDYQKVDLTSKLVENEDSIKTIRAFNYNGLLTYNDYKKYCEKWGINQKYNDSDKKYMMSSYSEYGSVVSDVRLANAYIDEDKVTLYLWSDFKGESTNIEGYFVVVPVSGNITHGSVNDLYTKEEYDMIKSS